MKKIDNWLSIQRYVIESAFTQPTQTMVNVEVWGKVRESKHSRRTVRRFLTPAIKTV